MRHYANETNWFNLYKVFEVIKNDIDMSRMLKLLTNDNVERFKYSANNANASGDAARHSLAEFPKNPSLLLCLWERGRASLTTFLWSG